MKTVSSESFSNRPMAGNPNINVTVRTEDHEPETWVKIPLSKAVSKFDCATRRHMYTLTKRP